MILLVFLIIGSVSATGSDDALSLDDASDTIADNMESDVLSNEEADVDDGNFASLDNAIKNVDAGGTVHLNTNVTLNGETSGEETTYVDGITISKDVTINGYDQTINATDANGNKVRLFNINSGAHVTLKDMTIAGAGYTGDGNNIGSAITVSGSSYLTLINVNFVDNYAHMTARFKAGGGAIMVTGGSTLNVTGGSFVGNTIRYDQAPNTACGGGAIDVNTGTLYVDGTTFENNTVDLGAISNQAGGGAIASLNSPISIVNSEFIGNRVILANSNAKGGAVLVIPNSGMCDIINNTFRKNYAYTVGALLAMSNNINTQGCIFEDNTADDSIIATFNRGGNIINNAFGSGQKISTDSYAHEESNWWGTNEPTGVGVTLNNWIVMTIAHDDTHVIAKLTTLNDGTAVANPELLPVREATITGLGETRKVKIINGIGTLTLDESMTEYAGNTVEVTVDGQSLSFVVNDKTKSFAELESNIRNTTAGTTYDVKGNFQLNTGVTGEEITYAQGIVIDKDITIDGHGLTINATDANGNKVRIFNIKDGANVVLKDIILVGGLSFLGGGAILVDGATLTLNDVIFTENAAANGGAVYSDNGNVNIINSTFIKNTASSAAGAVQISNGLIEGCIFEDNAASQGNAVTLATASASANYNMFLNNQTVSGSGNFDYNWWESNSPENVGVTLNNWLVLSISNNDTLIKAGLNTLNTGSDVPNPEKLTGIPIEIRWEANVNELNLENGVVTIVFDKPVTYDSSYNVTAKIYDFELNYTLKPDESDFNNFAQLDSKIKGENTTVNLTDDYKLNEVNVNEEITYKEGVVIDKNIAIDGQGHTINATDANGNKVRIFNINNANVTLKNMILTGSSVSALGGAIYINGGSLTLINVTFIDNQFTLSSGSTVGGAALTAVNAEVTISNSTFINNVLTKSVANLVAGGGAIYLNGGLLNVDNSLFESNRYSAASYNSNAAGGGGAIYTTTATTNIKNSRFIKNSATRTSGSGAVAGGALLIKTGTLIGNIFEENTATSAPNAVSVTDATGNVNYNVFVGTPAQTVAGSANYQANWWGTNNPSSVGVTLTNWLVMDYAIDGKNVSVTIIKLNDGSLVENTQLLPSRQANITLEGISNIINTTNGVATVKLIGDVTIGTSYDAIATIDSQTLTFTIKPSIDKLSIDSIVNASIGVDGKINVSVTGIEGVVPTGTVSLWLNNIEYTIDLTNGTGSKDLGHDLDGGDYIIYIKYNGDENYSETDKLKSDFIFNVAKLNATISTDTDKVYSGRSTYIWVTVSNDDYVPTGQVTVTFNGTEVTGDLRNGKIFIPVGDDLAVGNYDFVINYGGDTKFNAVTKTINLEVSKFDVDVTHTLSTDTFAEGVNGTIEVTVSPEGIVYYYNKPLFTLVGTNTDTSKLVAIKSASYYNPDKSVGANGLTVSDRYYSSDMAIGISIKANSFEFDVVSVTANKFRVYLFTAYSGTSFNTQFSYISYASNKYTITTKGASTITVSGSAPKAGDRFKITIVDRVLTYYLNGNELGHVSVSYDDAYFGIWTNRGVTTVVNNIVLDNIGKEPTQATYTPDTVPTGDVTIKVGNITRNVTLENGKATLNIGEELTEGTYNLEFLYPGDSIYANSSATGQLKVKKYLTPTINIDVPQTCELGQNITISVNVTGAEPVTGNVKVTVGDIVKTFNAEDGTFTFEAGETFNAGNHTIEVLYDGDDNYFMGTKEASFMIDRVDTTLDVTGGVSVIVGNDATITVQVNPGHGKTPTGSVTIISTNVNKTVNLDAAGKATYNIGADLPGGVHDVFVKYNGDINFNEANTTVNSMYTIINEIYVDATEGSDENGTGLEDKPFKSIKKAWSVINGNGALILKGVFTGSDNIGLTLSKTKMMNIDIVGNDAVIDAEVTRISLFTISKANVRLINLTINNTAVKSGQYGAVVNVADADYLSIINSTILNVNVQNGEGGAIYLQDYDVALNISNSRFEKLVANGVAGIVSTNRVNQGLSNARNKICIDNSVFVDITAYQDILVSSSRGFGAGADVVAVNSSFINFKGTQTSYSKFIESKTFHMSNCIVSGLDSNTKWNTWINVNEGSIDYNFWSSNDPDFSLLGSLKPDYWFLMTFDNESSTFTATLNTLNNGSAYENVSSLTFVDVIFSDNLNPSKAKLDENGTAVGILEGSLKVGEKVSATIGGMTISYVFKQDIEDISYDVTNAIRWENGTINITVNGRDNVIPIGNITVWVNNVPYTVDLVEGNGILFVGEDLVVGNYISKVQYNGDENYFASDLTEFVFGVEKANLNVSAIAESKEYGQEQTLTFALTSDIATGNLTVLVNDKPYTVYLTDLKLDLGILDADEYKVIVTYNGDENYNVAEYETSFNITKKEITPVVNYDGAIKVGQNQTIEVIFEDYDESAKVSFDFNGLNFVSISENKAIFVISDLKEGNYSVTVNYDGKNYFMNSVSKTFKVSKTKFEISAYAINATTGNNVSIIVSGIPDDVTGLTVVTVDGTKYGTQLVDGNYVATIPALKVETNTAYVLFNGDDKYESASASADFKILQLDVDVEVNVETEITKDSEIVISAPDATGEFIVIVDDEIKTIPIVDGNASYSLEDSTYGDHNIVVIYNGVVCYVDQFTIPKLDANIGASAEPVVEGKGDSIVVVTANATARGSVVIDDKYYGELSQGRIEIPISGLTNGTYVFTVKYSGDDTFEESETSVTVVVLEHIKSDANINASAEPVYVGKDAIVIVSANATAEGSIVIDDKYYGELSQGSAVIPISGLASGNYTFTVKYSGDDKFNESETTVTVSVNKYETAPEIIADSIELGEFAFIKVTLTDGATGNVTFYVDDEDPVTVDLIKGYAGIVVTDLTNGTHKVKVVYSGDDVFAGSDATKEFNVTYNIKIDGDSLYGEDAIIKVSLPDGAKGNVTVTIGNETFNATVEDGVAYVNASTLDYGTHNIIVDYSGDDKYPAKTVSSEITVDANIDIPEEVPYEAGEITFELPSNATGNVTVTLDNNDTIVVPVVDGKANIPLDNLSMGKHKVSAVYSGDDNYKPSSAVAVVTVNPKINVPDELTTGDNEIAISLPSDAEGNLTVNVDGNVITTPVVNGTASVAVSNLSAGDHDVSVDYSGDGKYDSFHKSLNGNVAKSAPSANVNAPASITAGKATSVAIELPKDATGVVLVDVDGNKYYATAENGVATVNIAGLSAGDKQLTYNYLGDDKYNSVKGTATLKVVDEPKPPVVEKIVLTSKNVKVKKSAKKLVLKATLKINGKVANGKKITFKFKGKKYTGKTNKKGVAKVTIKKKVIKKLKKGKKYKVKISYSNKKTITKKVTVKK